MQTQQFSEMLFDKAKAAGFSCSEVFCIQSDSFSASVHESEINSYEVASSLGLGFRGLYNGKMGYASTQILDEAAADQLVAGARMNATLIENEDPDDLFSGDENYPEAGNFSEALEKVSAEAKLEKLLQLEKDGLCCSPVVKKIADCILATHSSSEQIINSLGLNVSKRENYCGLVLETVAQDGDKVNSGLWMQYAFDFDKLDTAKVASIAVQEAVAGLHGTPVRSGKYNVAFRWDAASVLFGTFNNVYNAEAAQKGLSLLAGKENSKIASECITLIDDPLLPGGFGSTPFDAEGVASRCHSIISDGTFITLLHNRKTAAKQGIQTTGNASRSYSSSMGISPTNMYLKAGNCSTEELLRQMDNGLLITELQGMHSGANEISGDFSLSAKGFRIVHGVVDQPVSGITIAGNYFDVLRNMRLLADDLHFTHPAAIVSPTIWVGELTVGGT